MSYRNPAMSGCNSADCAVVIFSAVSYSTDDAKSRLHLLVSCSPFFFADRSIIVLITGTSSRSARDVFVIQQIGKLNSNTNCITILCQFTNELVLG
jgi:hypothetical protein